jgi:hypothetical protein
LHDLAQADRLFDTQAFWFPKIDPFAKIWRSQDGGGQTAITTANAEKFEIL